MTGFLDWLHSVFTALKPLVTTFLGYVGDMIANRPAPAGGVALSVGALILLAMFVPKILKKISK